MRTEISDIRDDVTKTLLKYEGLGYFVFVQNENRAGFMTNFGSKEMQIKLFEWLIENLKNENSEMSDQVHHKVADFFGGVQ